MQDRPEPSSVTDATRCARLPLGPRIPQRLPVAFALILILALTACGDPPTATFILAGQSNMGGTGVPQQLPEALRAAPERIRLMTDKVPHWGPLDAQEARELAAGARFGPEISFAHAIADQHPGRSIGVIKWTYGGSPISVWNPSLLTQAEMQRIPHVNERWVAKGPPFRQLIEVVTEMVEAGEIEVLGLAWMQGEGDSKRLEDANAYEASLRTLLDAFRSELGRPDLPIAIGLVNPAGGEYLPGAAEIVRAAQTRVAANDELIELVETADLSKDSDRVHYDGAGLIELGYRFSRSQVRLEERSRGILSWLDDLFRFLGRPAPF